MARRRRATLALLASLGVTFGAAAVGSAATFRSLDTWYRDLDKPPWNPPDAVFGPVWTVLYAAQAVAAWLVWRADPDEAGPALRLYGAQLLLNVGWSLAFFGLRRPALALLDIAALWIAIAVTAVAFWRRVPAAGWLLVPYLAWVSFAAALNWAIWRRNR